jgi:tetratricopeptide (TPR) repeat protein
VKSSHGSSVLDVGELAEQRGDYLDASAAYRRALEDPDALVVAEAHTCLGRLAWRQGNYSASREAFDKARAIAIRHGASDIRARAEIGLGNVRYALGDFAAARELYGSVLNLAHSAELRGKVRLNLGAISNIEGQLDAAESHYHEARRSFREAGDVHGEAQALHNLGLLHVDRVEWDAADESYATALGLLAEVGNRETVGLIIMSRSELSCAMGRYQEAIEHCDAATAIFAEIGAEVHRGTTLRWKGRALREMQNYVAAQRALFEAIRIAHRAQAKLLEAEAMQELGGTLALSGDHDAAKKWLRRALETFVALGATREADEVRADLGALGD